MLQTQPDIAELRDAVASYRSGMTLAAPFYLDPRYFHFDMQHVLDNNWWFARFSSELPNAGDYAVINIGAASIILTRGRDGAVRGFYNSCRHRGATLCREKGGNMARITCPYHAWTFGLDGALLSAPQMPDDFTRADYPLHQVHVGEERGMIFINLCNEAPPAFDTLMDVQRPALDFYDIANTRVVARKSYTVEANWKLAIENLVECYHCLPSHPSLCVVEGRDELQAYAVDPSAPGAAALIEKIQPRMDWLAEQLGATPLSGEMIGGSREETGSFAVMPYPLARGFATGTMDGALAAPYLGKAEAAAGIGVRVAFSTTTFLQVYCDHAVILSYMPQTEGRTIVEQAWVVNAAAKPDEQTIEKIVQLWDNTTGEDGWLAENQVGGVRQPVYQPGPLGNMEGGPKGFLDWYVGRMKGALDPNTAHRAIAAE